MSSSICCRVLSLIVGADNSRWVIDSFAKFLLCQLVVLNPWLQALVEHLLCYEYFLDAVCDTTLLLIREKTILSVRLERLWISKFISLDSDTLHEALFTACHANVKDI